MELILFALISLIVIVGVLASRLNDNSFPFPFDSKPFVFTPAEKNFQNLLEQAMGNKYRIINRVKLADIVTIRNGVSTRASQSAATNAEGKYLDFVICGRDNSCLRSTPIPFLSGYSKSIFIVIIRRGNPVIWNGILVQ